MKNREVTNHNYKEEKENNRIQQRFKTECSMKLHFAKLENLDKVKDLLHK